MVSELVGYHSTDCHTPTTLLARVRQPFYLIKLLVFIKTNNKITADIERRSDGIFGSSKDSVTPLPQRDMEQLSPLLSKYMTTFGTWYLCTEEQWMSGFSKSGVHW